jgi:hypothetical protein
LRAPGACEQAGHEHELASHDGHHRRIEDVPVADRQLAPKIRTLVDFLAERFGRSPAWDRGLALGSAQKSR